MRLRETIKRILIEEFFNESVGENFDAVLVGGLDYRNGDYKIDQQVELLKKGFGSNKKVKGFRYNTPTSEILNFLSQSPKIPIFLFSAGCTKASDLSNSRNVDVNKLYIIEPYAASSNTKQIVQSAVSNGVPSNNVFVGGSSGRGKGVVAGAVNSQSDSHWGALTKVGSMKTDISSSEQSKDIDNNDVKQIEKSSDDIRPKDIKDFQSWLDDNHSGWHKKYGTLGDSIQKGWGIYGPNTKRAWSNEKWREEYSKQNIQSIKKTEQNEGDKESSEKWIKCKNCNKRFTQTIHKGKKSTPVCPHCGTYN